MTDLNDKIVLSYMYRALMFSVFKAASHIDLIADGDEVRQKYRYWRLRIFFGMYIGYALFYLTRNSLMYIQPFLMSEFNWTKADIGIFGSILYVTYGCSKFLSGLIGDRSNPRYFMALGLILTGFFNIFFGLSSSLLIMSLMWGLNGLFQGWGWPPCARLLTHWYAQSERGKWWGIWNTSHNVGGALILCLALFVVKWAGWRMAMFVPGSVCVLGGLFLLWCLRDTPQSLGLPPIEEREGLKTINKEEREFTAREILVEHILKNRLIWTLAFAYFFVYVIRAAMNTWGILYLIEFKGYQHSLAAGAMFWFEMGGMCGSFSAGFLSDTMFASRRGPVNVIYSVCIILALFILWNVPQANYLAASFSVFLMGFLVFGPQMLIGMAAAELSHKKAAGTATGFAGWFGYAGAACGAYPIGVVATHFGWAGVFITLGCCSILAATILLPLWSVRKRQEELQKA